MLAEFDDIFNQSGSSVSPDRTVMIEGIVRTHGLTYNAASDQMVLTDIGAAGSDSDGAFSVINNYMQASSDGIVTLSEQNRIEGAETFLGNPVDIACDTQSDMIYIAERANGGGRVLGFINPTMSGSLMPSYNDVFAGASAIFSSNTSSGSGFDREGVTRMFVDVTVTNSEQETSVGLNKEINEEYISYKVSPNPATESIQLSIESNSNAERATKIDIYDTSGKLLMSSKSSQSILDIDISELSSGLYYILANRGYTVEMIKFIKQ